MNRSAVNCFFVMPDSIIDGMLAIQSWEIRDNLFCQDITPFQAESYTSLPPVATGVIQHTANFRGERSLWTYTCEVRVPLGPEILNPEGRNKGTLSGAI